MVSEDLILARGQGRVLEVQGNHGLGKWNVEVLSLPKVKQLFIFSDSYLSMFVYYFNIL